MSWVLASKLQPLPDHQRRGHDQQLQQAGNKRKKKKKKDFFTMNMSWVVASKLQPLPYHQRRGHDQQLQQPQCQTPFSFLPRTIKQWNELPPISNSSQTLDDDDDNKFLLRKVHGGEKACSGQGRVGKGDRRVKLRNRRQPRMTKTAVDRRQNNRMLRQCPSGIAQRPQHHAVSTAMQNRVTMTISVAPPLGNNWSRRSPTL